MKKISYLFLLLAGIFSLSFASCSDNDDDTPVPANDLPQAAKTFISQYFSDVKILGVEKDTEHSSVEYNVDLANGFDLSFNSAGEWIDVDAPAGQTIPDGIAPVKISDYVKANYSSFGINEISKENYGYDVELTNGLDLDFDANGDFIRIDK